MAEHDVFSREGIDLIVEASVSYTQAALGAEIHVPTLDGTALVTIPSGTQTGTVFRLRGKGMPDMRGRGNGDQFVRVTVVTPTRLTPEQKDLLKQLGRSLGDYEKSPKGKSVFDRFSRK
jgi:molecular chaperone DnaJ